MKKKRKNHENLETSTKKKRTQKNKVASPPGRKHQNEWYIAPWLAHIDDKIPGITSMSSFYDKTPALNVSFLARAGSS